MNPLNATWLNSEAMADAVMEWVRQPMTIALLASVGAHGLVFLGLPAVTGKAKPPETRTVRVTTLTPEEIAQLPSTPQPPLATSLAPLSNSLFSASVPNGTTVMPPAPPLGTVEPSASGSTSFYNVPLDGSNPGMDNLLSPSFQQWLNTPSTSASTTNQAATGAATNQSSTNQNLASRTITSSAIEVQLEEPEKTTATEPTNPQTTPPQGQPAPQNQQPAPQNPAPNATASNNPAPNNPPAGQSAPPATGTTANNSQSPAAPPPQLASAQEVLAQKQREIQQVIASYNAEDTKDRMVSTVTGEWWQKNVNQNEKVKNNFGNPNLKPEQHPQPLTYPYFFKLPNFKPEEPILLGTLVQPDGKPDPETVIVLKGSGYPSLNDIAKQAMLTKTFPATGKSEFRTVVFYFGSKK